MNFVLFEMTFLRYFLPLIIEGNKANIRSGVYICKPNMNTKYNSPSKHLDSLNKLAREYDFDVYDIDEIANNDNPNILIEGVGIDHVKNNQPTYSMTYMIDYKHLYDKYIDKVDYVIFPSKYYAEYYNKISDKNLYLGSPKYDVVIHKNEVLKNHNLDKNDKHALVLYPRNRDLAKIDLEKIYNFLHRLDYKIIVKTRGKDPVRNKNYRGDYYCLDESWFPHTTMELLSISDIVINFGSTSIKESILFQKPMINFHIKPEDRTFLKYFYEHPYCENLLPDVNYKKFENSVNNVLKATNEDYINIIKECLFVGNSSKRILDFILKNK